MFGSSGFTPGAPVSTQLYERKDKEKRKLEVVLKINNILKTENKSNIMLFEKTFDCALCSLFADVGQLY